MKTQYNQDKGLKNHAHAIYFLIYTRAGYEGTPGSYKTA